MDIAALPSLMLSGNFPAEVTFQGQTSPVSIYMNAELLMEEIYEPSASFIVTLKLRELLHSLLETSIPLTGDIIEQSASVADFEIHVEGQQGGTGIYAFRLVKGGVDTADLDSTSFLQHNFLTWKPQVKKVRYTDPQWLTYYAVGESRLIIQASWLENDELVTSDPQLLYTLPDHKKCTLNVKFEKLWSPFILEGRSPYYIDVWIADEGQDKLTYTQRYVLTDEFNEFDHLFVFENSLGGVDVIRFTGELENQAAHEFKTALFGNGTREYDLVVNRTFSKNTGYFRNAYELLWANDFLLCLNRWQYINGLPVRIVLKGMEAADIKTELNHYTFSYCFSEQSRFQNSNSLAGLLPGIAAEFSGMPSVLEDIYVRLFGDQVVDGSKTFLQPIRTNQVVPASGNNLVLNDLTVKDGGIIDCGEF